MNSRNANPIHRNSRISEVGLGQQRLEAFALLGLHLQHAHNESNGNNDNHNNSTSKSMECLLSELRLLG